MVRTRWTSATLALTLAGGLAACGGTAHHPPPPSTRCSQVAGAHVQVVVEVSPGRVLDRCIGVRARTIGAETAMRRSGIAMSLQHYSFGDAVCQLDHVPAAYTQCPGSGRRYWALFVAPAHGLFRAASTGISDVRLTPGETLGWRYDPVRGRAAPPRLPSRR